MLTMWVIAFPSFSDKVFGECWYITLEFAVFCNVPTTLKAVIQITFFRYGKVNFNRRVAKLHFSSGGATFPSNTKIDSMMRKQ